MRLVALVAIQKTDADNPALVVLKDENNRTQFDLGNMKGLQKTLACHGRTLGPGLAAHRTPNI